MCRIEVQTASTIDSSGAVGIGVVSGNCTHKRYHALAPAGTDIRRRPCAVTFKILGKRQVVIGKGQALCTNAACQIQTVVACTLCGYGIVVYRVGSKSSEGVEGVNNIRDGVGAENHLKTATAVAVPVQRHRVVGRGCSQI